MVPNKDHQVETRLIRTRQILPRGNQTAPPVMMARRTVPVREFIVTSMTR